MITRSIYIDVPVIQKDKETEEYSINILNVNYLRKWVGDKGVLQTVMYFQGSDKKFLIIDLPRDSVKARINRAFSSVSDETEETTSLNGSSDSEQ